MTETLSDKIKKNELPSIFYVSARKKIQESRKRLEEEGLVYNILGEDRILVIDLKEIDKIYMEVFGEKLI